MARDDFRFSFNARIRYVEVDMQGIMFNACYLTYYDMTIGEFLRSLAFDPTEQGRPLATDFHVVRSVVEYKAPVRFNNQIEILARVARLGRSSITFAFEMYLKDSDFVLSIGEIVWVNTDNATRRPVPVPEALRVLLRPHCRDETSA